MKTVSRFEANLLRILHGFFGRDSGDPVLKLVQTEMDCPPCLSRNAIALVEDTLQKGVPTYLARRGGWRRERFLRNGQIATGHLWNRTPPAQLGLMFSEHTLRFFMWITANHPNRPQQKFLPDESRLTTGDRLLFFLAYESLRGSDVVQGLMDQPPFQNHPLLWLVYVSDLMECECDASQTGDFSAWMENQAACILESMQPLLAERWLLMERQKQRIPEPDLMRKLGDQQDRLLTGLFDAAESFQRQDLCRFFPHAMKRHLGESHSSAPPYNLDLSHLRMAERAEIYQSAAVCFRQMARMDQWNRKARGIGFYDEGYAAAQLWKADWEQLDGDRLCAESQARLNALEPLALDGARAKSTRSQTDTHASQAN